MEQEWSIFFLIEKGTKESKTKPLHLILSADQELPYCRIKKNQKNIFKQISTGWIAYNVHK